MKKITLCTCKLPYYSPGSHLLFQIEESPMRASIFLRESWWAKRKSPPFLYFRENLRENKIVMYWCVLCVLFIYLLTISRDWIIIKLFFNIFFFGRQLIYHSYCSIFFLHNFWKFDDYFLPPGNFATKCLVPNKISAFTLSSSLLEALVEVVEEPPIEAARTSTRCLRLNFCLMACDKSESFIWLFTANSKSSHVQVILWYSIVGTWKELKCVRITTTMSIYFYE